MKKILFVCHGNICRSPTAHAILQNLRPDWLVDSAGTHAELGFQTAHPKTIRVAKHHSIDIIHKPQQLTKKHIEEFDHILVSDRDRLEDVYTYCTTLSDKEKVELIGSYANTPIDDIPDPYYELNFEDVFTLLEECCTNFEKKKE